MEIGNLLFGNSRGTYEVPREEFEKVLIPFMEDLGVGSEGYDKEPDETYATFDNELFTIRPYYWGDDEEIEELSNFIYKPTDFQMQWYKYPLRDAYMNQNINIEQFKNTIEECRKSVFKEVVKNEN